MDNALAELYGSDNLIRLADKDSGFDHSVWNRAVKWLHSKRGYEIDDKPVRDLINETYRVLSEGVNGAITEEVPAELTQSLLNNTYIFSGFKTYHEMRQASALLRSSTGGFKSFEKFYRDVKKIDNTYNRSYLAAEYEFAVQSTQMAVKWKDWEEDGDRYLLQYRTAGDERVREEHAALNNTTLPIDDKFWDSYLPPLGWRCRCTVVQVRKGKYPVSDSDAACSVGEHATSLPKQKIFRFNPGKTGKVFPPKHPYKKAPKAAKGVIEKVSAEEMRAKRIQDIIAELPDTLTQSEKQAIAENCLEIEQNYGIVKGKAMTYEQANTGKENPHYKQGGGYSINCQTCTVTHWLRRLGFNLQAQPNKVLHKRHQGTAYDIMDKAGIKWTERFVNLDGSKINYDYTYKWQIKKGYKSMTTQRLHEYLNEKLAEDGVYEIYCGWKGGNAHVFCAEVSDRKVHYFDPQSGENDVSGYIPRMNPGMVGVIRIDNKKINPNIGKLFLKVE